MTIEQIKHIVRSKFKIGQKVTLTLNVTEKNEGDKIKVKILRFYPNFVLTEKNGTKESFRYWDFLKATDGINPVVVVKPRAGHHLSAY
ncbi:MAG: hypothetical protein K0R00_3187 [Herbinix sp.]|jgi:uncharacterized protein Veg|nr:hypothetical protein [Herbinix sp.]